MTSEAVPRALQYRTSIEHAHAIVQSIGQALEAAPQSTTDLRPMGRQVENILVEIYDAIDQRADPLTRTTEAMAHCDALATQCNELGKTDPAFEHLAIRLRQARGELGVAAERYERVPAEPFQESPLKATKAVPALHRRQRASLRPTFKIADPLPPPPPKFRLPAPPATFDQMHAQFAALEAKRDDRRKSAQAALSAALDSAKTITGDSAGADLGSASEPALSPDEHIRRRARDCFEEVAMLGMQRAPLLGDPWRTAEVFERRMLCAVDAIAALGPRAVASLEPLVADAPAADPTRGFAMAFIMGCLDGRDALAAMERVFHGLGSETADVRRAISEALKLVPHPSLLPMLRQWQLHTTPAWRATAIEVLVHRQWASADDVVAAADDPSPLVRACALPAVGAMRLPELDRIVAANVAHDDITVRQAAWEAMALGGHQEAALAPEGDLAGEHRRSAAVAIAIACDRAQAQRLHDNLQSSRDGAMAFAVGWTGLVDAVPTLIAMLRPDDLETSLTAAFALMRITGAEMFEDMDMPPEQVDVPDVDEPDNLGMDRAPRLATEVSDPRDLPSDGAPDRMRLPTIRRSRWEAYWSKASAQFEAHARYRRGAPYVPVTSLRELDHYLVTPPERCLLQRELVIRTGAYVPLYPVDFVTVQEQALQRWTPHAQSASHSPGGWHRARPQ